MIDKFDNFLNRVRNQEKIKSQGINLIASENAISPQALEMQSSILSNRYILDDFPNNLELIEIKNEIKILLAKLFNAKYVNISALSWMNCMDLILSSITNPGDNIYVLNPIDWWHWSTHIICWMHKLNVNYLPYNDNTNEIDIDLIEKFFQKNKPDIIYLDNTMILFYHNVLVIKQIAEKYWAFVVYDGSHVLWLIAWNAFPNPLNDNSDILNWSTHKTLFWPQKWVIMTNNELIWKKIDSISADFISSSHTWSLLALYVSLKEIEQHGEIYAKQVVQNAKTLGTMLHGQWIKIEWVNRGITDTHQIWIDPENIKAQDAYNLLSASYINTNAIRIPWIHKEGLRLWVAEPTRMWMKEKEMEKIALFIWEVLRWDSSPDTMKQKVIEFTKSYQKILYTLENNEEDLWMIPGQLCEMHVTSCEYWMEDYIAFSSKYCNEYLSIIPWFQWMILRWGIWRWTADKYSDIDFTVIFDVHDIDNIINVNNLEKWMHRKNWIMFSARYVSLKDFQNQDWSINMLHAYSYVKLIQCSNKISSIIKEKTNISNTLQQKRVV